MCLRSYIEQIKTADAAVEKARMEGKAMVEEVQTLLNKEKQAWATERSSLSSRLEEVSVSVPQTFSYLSLAALVPAPRDACAGAPPTPEIYLGNRP